MTLDRRRFAAGLAAAGFGLAAVRPAAAAPRPVVVASLFGDDKPETRIWLEIRDRLEARLPGRFDFRIVRNAALGGEKEVAEGLRIGSVHATVSTISVLSAWVPATQILDLPFLFRDRDHARRVLDGAHGTTLKRALAAENFVVLATIDYGARHLLAKEPVTTPAGVAGKRIRVIQSPLHTELWKAYGALPTPLPIPETYNALKTGVVDMMDLTKSAYAGFKLYEVVPWLVETAHIRATGVVNLSAAFWATLAADEQAAFADAAVAGARFFDAAILADEDASMARAAAAGAKVVAPADLDAWKAGAQGVWTRFAPTVGGIELIRALAAA